MKPSAIKTGALLMLVLMAGMACRLTSPTPASWSGTPTAQARNATNTVIALTQQAGEEPEISVTPTQAPTITLTPTPKPVSELKGPWLVYPAPEGGMLQSYDVKAERIIEIRLPEPVHTADLVSGYSSNGGGLVVRAGSPLMTDQLALYSMALPSTKAVNLSPLLSIPLQRRIVTQEGADALEAFNAVTQPDGLTWSPTGRYLAFTAALDNNSSDLYVYNVDIGRVDRLNGLNSQNASPFWSPGGNWLISQELGDYDGVSGWRATVVTRISVPGYENQNTLYLPISESLGEVFVGWINAQTFVSYSQTAEGPHTLRQVNVETLRVSLIFDGLFDQVAVDPVSKVLAFSLSPENGVAQGLVGGVYLLRPTDSTFNLQHAGSWKQLTWDAGGMFVANGSQGVLAFSPEGESVLLANEKDARLSPQGDWMIAWGDGEGSEVGARLYQSLNNHPLQTLTDQLVEAVLWHPDASAFFLQSEGRLYQLTFPGLNMVEIAAGFSDDIPLDMIWVE